MAMVKRNLFEINELEVATICKALGHPARIKILKILLRKNHQNCMEIVEQIPLAQATVSQHLSELKHAGLVIDKKVANKVFYSINSEAIHKADTLIHDVFFGHKVKVKQQTLF